MWVDLLSMYLYIGTSIFVLIDVNKNRIVPNDKVLCFYQFLAVIPLIGPVIYYFKVIQKNRYSISDYIRQIKCLQCGVNDWSLIEKGNFSAAWIVFLIGITVFAVSGGHSFINKVAVVISISGAIFLCYSRFVLRCKKCQGSQEIKKIEVAQ